MRAASRSTEQSIAEFREAFADERICAELLLKMRWPHGFVCPHCYDQGWRLATPVVTYQCRNCGTQTSIKARTSLHGSRLPIKVWFWGAHLIATSTNPVPVRHFQKLLGIRSYKAAFELRRTLLSLAADYDNEVEKHEPLEGLVEVNRTELHSTLNSFSRVESRKIAVAVALEVTLLDGKTATRRGRIRLGTMLDSSEESIAAFVQANVKPGATLFTDGHRVYRGLTGYQLHPHWNRPPATEEVFTFLNSWFKVDNLDRDAVERGLDYIRAKFAPKQPRVKRRTTFETLLRLALRDIDS